MHFVHGMCQELPERCSFIAEEGNLFLEFLESDDMSPVHGDTFNKAILIARKEESIT